MESSPLAPPIWELERDNQSSANSPTSPRRVLMRRHSRNWLAASTFKLEEWEENTLPWTQTEPPIFLHLPGSVSPRLLLLIGFMMGSSNCMPKNLHNDLICELAFALKYYMDILSKCFELLSNLSENWIIISLTANFFFLYLLLLRYDLSEDPPYFFCDSMILFNSEYNPSSSSFIFFRVSL